MNYTSHPIKPPDWGALIMGLMLLSGASIFIALAGFLALFGFSKLPVLNSSEPLSMLILAGGTFLLGVLLLPGFYFNYRRFFNKPIDTFTLPALDDRILIPGLITTWAITLVLGQFSSANPIIFGIILPALNIIAVGLPILFYLRISLRGIKLPSAQRGWSIFGASLIISPMLSLIFEILAVAIVIFFFLLYSSIIPGLSDVLMSLINNFQSSSMGDDETMRLAANLLYAPGAAFSALVTFAIAIPFIEETFKIILILPFLGRIRRPIDGFVLGILCGSAFALAENIGFTSTGSSDWAINVAARASAALPHLFNSGLLGWGLVSAWTERRLGQLAVTFLSVILVHGIWNTVSLGLAMNNLASYVANVPFYLQHSYPWITAWLILTLGAFGGLIFYNFQLQKPQKNESAEKLGYNSRLSSQTLGENDYGNPENSD